MLKAPRRSHVYSELRPSEIDVFLEAGALSQPESLLFILTSKKKKINKSHANLGGLTHITVL